MLGCRIQGWKESTSQERKCTVFIKAEISRGNAAVVPWGNTQWSDSCCTLSFQLQSITKVLVPPSHCSEPVGFSKASKAILPLQGKSSAENWVTNIEPSHVDALSSDHEHHLGFHPAVPSPWLWNIMQGLGTPETGSKRYCPKQSCSLSCPYTLLQLWSKSIELFSTAFSTAQKDEI